MMLYALQKAKEEGNEKASDILDLINHVNNRKQENSIDEVRTFEDCARVEAEIYDKLRNIHF
jgi:hypothetical protein